VTVIYKLRLKQNEKFWVVFSKNVDRHVAPFFWGVREEEHKNADFCNQQCFILGFLGSL
jgi:hypothetical protein